MENKDNMSQIAQTKDGRSIYMNSALDSAKSIYNFSPETGILKTVDEEGHDIEV